MEATPASSVGSLTPRGKRSSSVGSRSSRHDREGRVVNGVVQRLSALERELDGQLSELGAAVAEQRAGITTDQTLTELKRAADVDKQEAKKLEADVRTLKQEVQTKQQGLQEIASRVEGEQRRVTSGETAVKELYTTRDSLWQQLEELGVARQDRVMLGALIKYQRLCRSTAVHPKGMPLPREVLLPTRAATPAAAATRAAVPAVPPPEDAHRHASEGAIGAVSDTGFSKASADAGKGSDVDCGTGPDAGSGAGPEVTGVDPGVFDPRSVSASLVLPQSPADRNFEMKPETKIGLDPASVAAVGIPRDANSVIDLIYATDPGAALEKGGLVDELRKSSMVRRAVGLPEPGSPGVQEAEDELFALLAVGSAHVTAEQAKQWLEQSRRGSLANSGGWCSVCQSGGVLSYFQQLMQGR